MRDFRGGRAPVKISRGGKPMVFRLPAAKTGRSFSGGDAQRGCAM
jgi:hypothetical protein